MASRPTASPGTVPGRRPLRQFRRRDRTNGSLASNDPRPGRMISATTAPRRPRRSATTRDHARASPVVRFTPPTPTLRPDRTGRGRPTAGQGLFGAGQNLPCAGQPPDGVRTQARNAGSTTPAAGQTDASTLPTTPPRTNTQRIEMPMQASLGCHESLRYRSRCYLKQC